MYIKLFLNFSSLWNSIWQRQEGSALTLLVFRTKQGTWHKQIQMMKGYGFPSSCKNYKLGPTYLRLTIFYWQSNTFTSTANTMVLVIRALCKLVFPNLPQKFDQSTLISGTPFFSQWYFPSSENLWQIIASSPFLTPCSFMLSCVLTQLASLAQIRELAHRLFRRHP